MQIKQNLPLAIGIAIPILMILFVVGSIYLPGIFIHPQYNFLYVSNSYPYYGDYGYVKFYTVDNGKLIQHEPQPPAADSKSLYRNPPPTEPQLYLYDVKKDSSSPISYDDARGLSLDQSTQSPDGFRIDQGSRDYGFFPFFMGGNRDYNARYLMGHGVSRKLNLQVSGYSYDTNFKFLGWVTK
ncbi:MAG: hypothetical protein HYT40_00345 [Candidatus Sungbacteria bacterium]|uniref:Uncharacterized protein n=1 Tax=Candidatus Sungiibacteriota bacterium TaxID=2750080 RepID=A0A931WNT2_9BACT|nr:hypothetical protein [Candidatus Sungbacteria bacterium]